MSKFKKFKVRGSDRFMVDGKLVSESKIPPHILKILSNVPTFDDDIPEPVVSNKCVFCGEKTKLTRFLNLVTIPICDEHYHSETVGNTIKRFKESLSGDAEQPNQLEQEKAQEAFQEKEG